MRTLADLARCLAFGALVLWAWLAWIGAAPMPLPLAVVVTGWGLRGICQALAP